MFTTAVVIGAGQAGLAVSRCLTEDGIDHVVLERGRIAERWRSERWDSLRLLTPNWMSRLPGWSYGGPEPDGFMTMPEVTGYLTAYARSFDAPVQDETSVHRVSRHEQGYLVETDRGPILTRAVFAATGACAVPTIPICAAGVPAGVHQTSPKHYKNPDQLPDGGVIVVGASASGVQLAREIHQSGRPVLVAVGRHTRLPRRYRGLDIQEWLDMTGTLDRRFDEVDDIEAARRAPSLQLVGTADGRTLDLATLAAEGVRLAGRLESIKAGTATFADDLATRTAEADDAQRVMLDRIDSWASRHGLDSEIDAAGRPAPTRVTPAATRLELDRAGISTIIWATGYRPDYSWLDVPVFDLCGRVRHDGGVVQGQPGLYLMGLPFMRTRRSTFIDGVGADARELVDDLVHQLRHAPQMA